MVMTVYVVVVIQDFADDTKQQNICSNIKGQNIFVLFYNKYPNNWFFVMVMTFFFYSKLAGISLTFNQKYPEIVCYEFNNILYSAWGDGNDQTCHPVLTCWPAPGLIYG